MICVDTKSDSRARSLLAWWSQQLLQLVGVLVLPDHLLDQGGADASPAASPPLVRRVHVLVLAMVIAGGAGTGSRHNSMSSMRCCCPSSVCSVSGMEGSSFSSSFGSASTICCYECTMRGSAAVCSSRLVLLRLGSRRAATYPVLCPKRCQDVARATVDEGNETDAYGETLIVPRITIKETRAAQIHSISTPGHFSLQIDFPAHWDFPGDTALCDVGLAGWVSRGIEAVWTICDDKGSRWVGLVPTACTTGPGEWKVHE